MMKGISPRLINWVMILAIVGAVIYFGRAGEPPKPAPLVANPQIVRSDFLGMTGVSQPMKSVLGGRFYATELLLPEPFTGKPGTRIYARMEDGHEAITALYEIKSVTDQPAVVHYRHLKNEKYDFTPPGSWKRINLTGAEIRGESEPKPGAEAKTD
ncbi:MAG: hypothetical protein ACM3QZ_07950 [Solirubrobacterales bacterium]